MARCAWFGCVCLVAALSIGCSASAPEPASNEVEGTWQVSQIFNDGIPVPQEELQGMTWTFTGDRLTMVAPDEGPDEMTYSIDPTLHPKAMDLKYQTTMTFADDAGGTRDVDRLLAIYKLDRDTLTVALRPPTVPQERPTSFEAEEGAKLSVMVLSRLRK